MVGDELILTAARDLFLQHGFAAPTPKIARRAGISEALLFKRFGTKDRLFGAALGYPETPAWVARLNALAGQGTARANLLSVAGDMTEFFREVLPRQMLRWSSRSRPATGKAFHRPPMRSLHALTRYLRAEMQLRRIRRCAPEAAARCLLGALQNQVLFEVLSGAHPRAAAQRRHLRDIVGVLWHGLAPSAGRGKT